MIKYLVWYGRVTAVRITKETPKWFFCNRYPYKIEKSRNRLFGTAAEAINDNLRRFGNQIAELQKQLDELRKEEALYLEFSKHAEEVDGFLIADLEKHEDWMKTPLPKTGELRLTQEE